MRILLPILTLLGLFLGSQAVKAQNIYALTSTNDLVVINPANPGIVLKTLTITGIQPGAEIVGMDFRPATGQLYLFSYFNLVVQSAQLYTVDTATGIATIKGNPILNTPFTGQIAFDFNPTVDRIRVETSTGLNFRLHPETGAIVATDGNLAYAANDVNAGIKPNIGACAYTNSFIASTSTTLFTYDDSLNVFAIQNPPNNGVLNTISPSGIIVNPADPSSDFDIWFDKLTGQNLAFFAANSAMNNADVLYQINLASGTLTSLGSIGNNLAIKDIAIEIDRTKPQPIGDLAYALNSNNLLLSFNTGNPDYIISATPVTGVTAGYALSGMDVRPLTGEIYLFAYNSALDAAKIYTLNKSTAAATQVNTDSILNLGLVGQINFDFNPTVDRIRLSSSNNKNYRLNPITGGLAAIDGNLKFNTGDVNFGKDPAIGAVAYSNSYPGATSTTLFVYDDSLNVFATQIPPNDGVLNTIASSGLTIDLADRTSDLDIYFDPTQAVNTAYFSANTSGSTFDKLYQINLTNGTGVSLGNIGYGIAIKDITVAIDRTAPAPNGQLAFGLTSNNNLISFYTGNPEYILSQIGITGVAPGYSIVGTDYRTVGGLLYAVAYNATTKSARLYTINESTSVASTVSNDSISPIDLSGRVAVDFNPTVDRIRVETSNNKNYRLNPITGLIAANDLDLNYKAGDVNFGKDPNIGSCAYINSRAGATTTTLYAFDDSLSILASQVPPNDGVLNTIGATGITQSTLDQTSDLDIYYDQITSQDIAYLTSNTSNSFDKLYQLNLLSGAATLIGNIGFGIALNDFAVKPAPASVGITENEASKYKSVVSPNPVVGDYTTLRFELENATKIQYQIIDITGKLMFTSTKLDVFQGSNAVNINTSNLVKGFYLINVLLESGTQFNEPFIK